jgi:hypothetical protein
MGDETRQNAYRMEKLSLVGFSRGARLVAPEETSRMEPRRMAAHAAGSLARMACLGVLIMC